MMGRIMAAIKFLRETGIRQSGSNISRYIGSSAESSLLEMVRDGYLTVHGGEYYPTSDAVDWQDAAPLYATTEDYGPWLQEVVTGINSKGEESSIVNPVVPSGMTCHTPDDRYEGLIDKIIEVGDDVLSVAEYTGIEPGEVWCRSEDGLVQLCNRCGEQSVFHRRSDNGRIRSACVVCSKKRR